MIQIDSIPPTKVFKETALAYNRGESIIVHSGGTSSAKTYSIIQFLLTIASHLHNQVITVAGQDIPNLSAGSYRDCQNIIADTPYFQQELLAHNKSKRQFTFKNGSIIEFNSYDDSQDAKNGKRDFLFVNEANGVNYDIFEELQVRTKTMAIIDFNPTASFWAHERLQSRSDVRWIDTTYRDNPYIDKSIKDKILSYEPTPENIKRGTANEYRWKVYGLGEVGRLEGLVFSDFRIATSYPDEYKWRTYGMDFGYTNDPTTLIEIRYAQGNLYMRQHIYETGLTNPDIADKLEQLGIDRDEKIIADSAEPKSIAELRRMGWNVKPAVKGMDSIMNGIDSLKRYPIYIDARSKDLIAEFSSYTWAKDRNGNSLNKPIDQYNHGIDAIRYAVSLQVNKPQREFDIFYA
jgi:phage terminase large subunit